MVFQRDPATAVPVRPVGQPVHDDAAARKQAHDPGHAHAHAHAAGHGRDDGLVHAHVHGGTDGHARVVDEARGSVLLAGLTWRLTLVVPVLAMLWVVLHGSLAG